jgi:hypothetical protein
MIDVNAIVDPLVATLNALTPKDLGQLFGVLVLSMLGRRAITADDEIRKPRNRNNQ